MMEKSNGTPESEPTLSGEEMKVGKVSFSSPPDVYLRYQELEKYLQLTPYRNMRVIETNTIKLQSEEREVRASIDIDAHDIESEEEYNNTLAILTDVLDFPLKKVVHEPYIQLVAKKSDVEIKVYLWLDWRFRDREEEFLDFLSKVAGCKMVRKTTYHKESTSTGIACELK